MLTFSWKVNTHIVIINLRAVLINQWSLTHTGLSMLEISLTLVFNSLAFQKPVVDFDQILSLNFWSRWNLYWGYSVRYIDPTLIFSRWLSIDLKPRIELPVFHQWLWCHLYHKFSCVFFYLCCCLTCQPEGHFNWFQCCTPKYCPFVVFLQARLVTLSYLPWG